MSLYAVGSVSGVVARAGGRVVVMLRGGGSLPSEPVPGRKPPGEGKREGEDEGLPRPAVW